MQNVAFFIVMLSVVMPSVMALKHGSLLRIFFEYTSIKNFKDFAPIVWTIETFYDNKILPCQNKLECLPISVPSTLV